VLKTGDVPLDKGVDGDTAKEGPKAEVSESDAKRDDKDADRSDSGSEKSGSDMGDRAVKGDGEHEVGDESSSRLSSIKDVDSVAESASTEAEVAREKVLDGALGTGDIALSETLEAAASASEDAVLKTGDVPLDKGVDGDTAKEGPKAE
ncbi:MAG: hypothetical protein PV344_03585, partial [Anaplasma sp.]|nr:hypothetical protein [Anaplasma sp.]